MNGIMPRDVRGFFDRGGPATLQDVGVKRENDRIINLLVGAKLTTRGTGARRLQSREGNQKMRRTLIAWGLILVGFTLAPLPAALAQSIPIVPSAIPNATDLTPLKLFLDQLQQTIGHPGHTDQSLAELREKLVPIRDGLRERFDVLDPRLADVDSRLSQLGPAPAAGAPPETQTIAQERAQLSQARAEVDSALKETRLLSVRAEDLAARINESRRSLFSRTLLQRTPGVLDKGFWTETDRGFYAETQGLSFLLTSWSEYARRNGGIWGAIASAAALIGYAALVIAVLYAWRQRFSDAVTADRGTSRSERALAALLVFLRHALIVPVSVFVVLK